jgi:tRNA threonylcarbamoyl adenosine modification protein YjeE
LGPEKLSEKQLEEWGERIGREVEPPLWIAMAGPLGAGKSVLARSVCRGAGVSSYIPSPSFTLVQRYTSPRGFLVHHVDLFRLQPGDPMDPLGWDDLLADPGIVLLEWADRAGDLQPSSRWDVTIDYVEDPGQRAVKVAKVGAAPELVEW